ncbi:MAG: FtsB family cell division protein [Bacilli bacterium]|jgi:cell division protein DivIC
MKKTKITKKTQRRFILLGTLSLFIVFSICVSISNYWVQIYKKNNERLLLQEKLKSLKVEEGDLQTEVQKLQDPDYIARYARERLLYSRDGEFIIRIP